MENIYEQKSVVNNYELSRKIPENILMQYAQFLVENTGVSSMCEVGFGKGSTLIPFSRLVPSIGIDSSQAMCGYVLNKVSDDTQIICADASSMNLEPQELIHMKAVTHIPANPYSFLEKVVSFVKPEGFFAIGYEVSQPEDNLENIGEYGKDFEEDSVLKDFYEKYFLLRNDMGIPFTTPVMPAGNTYAARRFVVEKLGLKKHCTGITHQWNKILTLNEILTAMSSGSFSVFRKDVHQNMRETLVERLTEYSIKQGYNLFEKREYPARLRVDVFKKE